MEIMHADSTHRLGLTIYQIFCNLFAHETLNPFINNLLCHFLLLIISRSYSFYDGYVHLGVFVVYF